MAAFSALMDAQLNKSTQAQLLAAARLLVWRVRIVHRGCQEEPRRSEWHGRRQRASSANGARQDTGRAESARRLLSESDRLVVDEQPGGGAQWRALHLERGHQGDHAAVRHGRAGEWWWRRGSGGRRRHRRLHHLGGVDTEGQRVGRGQLASSSDCECLSCSSHLKKKKLQNGVFCFQKWAP